MDLTRSVAIGFRAKTGKAIAVVLSGTSKAPQFVWRGEASLIDPKATIGPYHEVMELPWDEALVAVKPLVASIQEYADSALRAIVDNLRSRKLKIRGIAVAGSPPRPLEKIGNQHIRAHAAEGILFRSVLEIAAKHHKLPCLGLSDRDLVAPTITKEIGRAAGRPWRADERMAAAAALRVMRNE